MEFNYSGLTKQRYLKIYQQFFDAAKRCPIVYSFENKELANCVYSNESRRYERNMATLANVHGNDVRSIGVGVP